METPALALSRGLTGGLSTKCSEGKPSATGANRKSAAQVGVQFEFHSKILCLSLSSTKQSFFLKLRLRMVLCVSVVCSAF